MSAATTRPLRCCERCRADISARHGQSKFCVNCSGAAYAERRARAMAQRRAEDARRRAAGHTGPQRLPPCRRCEQRVAQSRRHKYCHLCAPVAKLETQQAIRTGHPAPAYALQAQQKHLEPAWLVDRLIAAAAARRKRIGRMTLTDAECWAGAGISTVYAEAGVGAEA
jgi:hypothetical protein